MTKTDKLAGFHFLNFDNQNQCSKNLCIPGMKNETHFQ